jgi:phosphoribosylanthranilate isomerase
MSIWIKICGLRDVETARAVADLRPDAVGLNFYVDSPRAVSIEAAQEIVGVLPASLTPVGVFVNHAPADVLSICERVGLSTVQLHGDESIGMIAQLDGLQIIRAVRVGEETLDKVAEQIERIEATGVKLAACLVDAHVPGAYGGTGRRPPWDVLAAGWDREHWPPLVLAGGLHPANVADGIRTVRPWGVDVASGVESSPGVKDLERVGRFIAAARAAASDLK